MTILYEVPTKVFNQAVKRTLERFPEDFMFKLNKEELVSFSRSQIVTLKKGRGNNFKYTPSVFTEQGIAILSSVLKSQKAIQINIQIIKTFTKSREMIDTYKELRDKVEEIEKNNEITFREILNAIRLLIKQEDKKLGNIGFDIHK